MNITSSVIRRPTQIYQRRLFVLSTLHLQSDTSEENIEATLEFTRLERCVFSGAHRHFKGFLHDTSRRSLLH
jgi:hypothetical protein